MKRQKTMLNLGDALTKSGNGIGLTSKEQEDVLVAEFIKRIEPLRHISRIYRKDKVLYIMHKQDSQYGKSTQGIYHISMRCFMRVMLKVAPATFSP